VATKRFGAALEWITKVLAKTMVRQEPLLQTYAELGIISDASPWGVGAMLVFPSTGEPQVTILEALEAPVTREEAKMLGQEYGSSSSQAVMETFAVLR